MVNYAISYTILQKYVICYPCFIGAKVVYIKISNICKGAKIYLPLKVVGRCENLEKIAKCYSSNSN